MSIQVRGSTKVAYSWECSGKEQYSCLSVIVRWFVSLMDLHRTWRTQKSTKIGSKQRCWDFKSFTTICLGRSCPPICSGHSILQKEVSKWSYWSDTRTNLIRDFSVLIDKPSVYFREAKRCTELSESSRNALQILVNSVWFICFI